MRSIAIIGGGLSGTLVAMNLLEASTDQSISIKLLDSRDENDLGPAYSADEGYLLNVRAGLMGAVSNEPEHFWNWLQNKNINADKIDFVPRKLYREYVQELFRNALKNKRENISFERIHDRAFDIKSINDRTQIILAGGKSFKADKIVLALGNFTPRNPELKNNDFTASPFYVQNPWNSAFLNLIPENASVLFIGTGQTMVDLACALHRQGHKGRIVAISKHGFLPLTHKIVEPYPPFYDKLRNVKSAVGLFRIIRKEIQSAERSGSDRRAVIDSLRPYTQQIWMSLENEEKRRFLRHLFRYWEINRSRIPPQSSDVINLMQSIGQLSITAGKIISMVLKDKGIEISYTVKNSEVPVIQFAEFVVNCIGPELDYNRIQDPLVKNLLKSGLIQPDPLNQGINALANGRIIHKNGSVSNTFFTIGLPLKGILWECLAAPEIREQAKNLSVFLLN